MGTPSPGRAQAARAAFMHSPRLEEYHYPAECPFSSDRAGKVRKTLASMGLLAGSNRREVAPEPAGRAALETFHIPEYLDALEDAQRGHLGIEALGMGLGTPDCPVFDGMYEYAALACGASLTGAELILAGEVDVAFNPSGGYHHAHPASAAGFCYVNDVAIACLRLADEGKRILYIDIDAHHGDGMQEAFYDRCDVLTISFHESGRTLFPGTGFEDDIGAGAGEGYSVNVPLPAGVYDEAFLRAFRAVTPPLAEAFGPDVVVMELGMDGLAGDPLTHMGLTNNAHAEVILYALGLGRPILAVGGGGYHIANTVRGWAMAWSVLCGEDDGTDDMAAGLGGVMLETTDWRGGLRDRVLAVDDNQRRLVEPAIDATIEKVKKNVFTYHGLQP